MQTVTQTIETRLPKGLSTETEDTLSRFAAHYHNAFCAMLALKNKGNAVNKPDFLKKYSVTSRQFNAIKGEVDGLFQSQLSNYQRYCVDAEHRLVKKHTQLGQVKSALQQAKEDDRGNLYNEKRGIERYIQMTQAKVKRWTALIKTKRISVCLGSRKRFKAQHELQANGYASHAEWKADHQLARQSEIVALGSKDETHGNQSCSVFMQDNGLFTLKLRLPTSFEQKHLVIQDIAFNYRPELLIEALQDNAVRSELKTGWQGNLDLIQRHQRNLQSMQTKHHTIVDRMIARGDKINDIEKAKTSYLKKETQFAQYTQANALCDFGRALSYRFKRDSKGWRVIVSITKPVNQQIVTDKTNGAIGVDLNAHHLSIAEMDNKGSKVQTLDVVFRNKDYADTSEQVKAGLGEAIKTLTELSINTGKPIIIENLDFSLKKARLGKDKTYNRLMSSLVTQKFLSILTLRCAEKGIELIKVNAAYTSLIGRLKYHNEVSHNTHQAAAMVIARRGMGLTDRRMPKHYKGRILGQWQSCLLPADNKQNETFTRYKTLKQKYDQWFNQILCTRRLAIQQAKQVAQTEAIFI